MGGGHASWGHSTLCPTLTCRGQLRASVVVHLDGARLKTQGWRDRGRGEIRGGQGAREAGQARREVERAVSMGDVWRGHKGRLLLAPSSPPNNQGSSAILLGGLFPSTQVLVSPSLAPVAVDLRHFSQPARSTTRLAPEPRRPLSELCSRWCSGVVALTQTPPSSPRSPALTHSGRSGSFPHPG